MCLAVAVVALQQSIEAVWWRLSRCDNLAARAAERLRREGRLTRSHCAAVRGATRRSATSSTTAKQTPTSAHNHCTASGNRLALQRRHNARLLEHTTGFQSTATQSVVPNSLHPG